MGAGESLAIACAARGFNVVLISRNTSPRDLFEILMSKRGNRGSYWLIILGKAEYRREGDRGTLSSCHSGHLSRLFNGLLWSDWERACRSFFYFWLDLCSSPFIPVLGRDVALLVNNVGGFMDIRPFRRFLEYSLDEEDKVRSINQTSTLRMIRLILPRMVHLKSSFSYIHHLSLILS